VRDESLLDLSLTAANERIVSPLNRAGMPAARRVIARSSQRFRNPAEAEGSYSLSTATSGPLSRMGRWSLLELSGADTLLARCSGGGLFFVITNLAQDPIVDWLAGVLSLYCALLAVVLRSERIARNRSTSLSPKIWEKPEEFSVNALAEQPASDR
jgi:hypothetical protein